MNKYHQELLRLIKDNAGKPPKRFGLAHYLGTHHRQFYLKVPVFRKLVASWAKQHKDISFSELITLIDSLSAAKSVEEKCTGPLLLDKFPKLRQQLPPSKLEDWLLQLEGWAEIDSFTQAHFSPEEISNNFIAWKKTLRHFASSDKVNLQRASLVLLTQPVHKSPDSRLSGLAFQNLNDLKAKREILVTKAESWLLRDLIKHHRRQVEQFLKDNTNVLLKFVLREVTNKLSSGHKSGK